MDDNISSYRSSLVTAIGIMLGFILAYGANWATQTSSTTDWTDYTIGLGLTAGIILQIIAMYRILDNSYPKASVAKYYNRTFKIFILGLCFSFAGVIVSIFQSIFS